MRYLLRVTEILLLISFVFVLSTSVAPSVQLFSEAAKSYLKQKQRQAMGLEKTDSAASTSNDRPVLNANPLLLDPDQLDIRSTDFTTAPHIPVAFIQINATSDPSRLAERTWYFKVSAFDRFVSNHWIHAGEFSLVRDLDDGLEDGVTTVDSAPSPPLFYTVFLPHLAYDALPGLSRVVWIGLPEVKRSMNDTYHLNQIVPTRRFRYEVASTPRYWEDVGRIPATPPQARPNYTEVPKTGLARLIQGQIPPSALGPGPAKTKINRLLDRFKTAYAYDRHGSEALGDEPMDRFLLGEKKGDCKHFATAMTLMLRSLDIPSRIVVGYAGGELNPKNNLLTFFADEGHAWVEALIDRDDWITIDPTPPSLQYPPHPPTITQGGITAGSLNFPDLAGLITPEDAFANIEPAPKPGFFQINPVGRIGIVSLLVFMVCGAVIVLTSSTKARRGPKRSSKAFKPARGKIPRFLRLFLRHFAKAGHPFRPGQTLCEYLLELQNRELVQEEFHDLVAYVYGISYADHPRDPELEHAFMHQIRAAE